MSYEQLAYFARNGGTLFFFTFFVLVLIYIFLPGSKKRAVEAADIVFDDDHPIIDAKQSGESS